MKFCTIFRPATGVLAGLVLFLALGAKAQTTNGLSDSEIEGRKLAQQLCDAEPIESFTNIGVLKIRDGQGNHTELPFTYSVATHLLYHSRKLDWRSSYEATLKPQGDPEVLAIEANHGKPNFYIHHLPFHAEPGIVWRGDDGKSDAALFVPFANSDFWLCDLGLEFFHWPEQKVLPKTTNLKRGRDYTLLESTNPNPATNGYSRVLSWIDKETGGILEAEAYDFNGRLLKDFAPKSFKKVNGQWELQEMEIRNVQTGSRTRLEFDLPK